MITIQINKKFIPTRKFDEIPILGTFLCYDDDYYLRVTKNMALRLKDTIPENLYEFGSMVQVIPIESDVTIIIKE